MSAEAVAGLGTLHHRFTRPLPFSAFNRKYFCWAAAGAGANVDGEKEVAARIERGGKTPPIQRWDSSFFNLHPTNRRADGPIGRAAPSRLNHSTATNNNNNENPKKGIRRWKKEKKILTPVCLCVKIVHQSIPPSISAYLF